LEPGKRYILGGITLRSTRRFQVDFVGSALGELAADQLLISRGGKTRKQSLSDFEKAAPGCDS
jgi:hypothetical protein